MYVLEERGPSVELFYEIGDPERPMIVTVFSGDRNAGHFELLRPVGSTPLPILPFSIPSPSMSVLPVPATDTTNTDATQKNKW